MYKTICDILQKEDVDHDDEVMYDAASIQLMEACIGTDAHKKVKGLLPLASLNKCLHDLAKEQKVAQMVVECVNCEYYCHEGDANLPFDACRAKRHPNFSKNGK